MKREIEIHYGNLSIVLILSPNNSWEFNKVIDLLSVNSSLSCDTVFSRLAMS